MNFSLIVPVFNRPDEIRELLQSIAELDFDDVFEVVIIEDGSTVTCETIVKSYIGQLDIAYYQKQNSGPGDSRNFGMQKAKGDYFLIFDSDCILPKHYLLNVKTALQQNYVDCFGGPDKALDSFSDIQKAINFAMTSFISTGGVRGGSESIDKFQPRSFNMGLSRNAFISSGGFGNIHPGEDPDLAIRLWRSGFNTKLIPQAYVYHKRRISWSKFRTQVSKFGKARPILNKRYPEYAKFTYFFPTFFCIGFILGVGLAIVGFPYILGLFAIYFLVAFVMAFIGSKSIRVASLALVAIIIQFYGYGVGFAESYIKVQILNKVPENSFPELFFKSK